MANFRVKYSDGSSTSYSGEGSRCFVTETDGVLTVFDGTGQRLRFAPGYWLSIQDEAAWDVDEIDVVTS